MTPIQDIYNLFLQFPRISTDSRNIIPDSLFFAIKGDKFNGNQFADEAIVKGARYAIVDEPSMNTGNNLLLVPDTIQALQQLAMIHRQHIKAKIIAITGSNGKTTTKELTGIVLSSEFNTVITPGNLNNHIGVPLTILSITNDTEFAVVEMGANHPGEIVELCRIAQPDAGLITNIGKAHLEGFGSFEGVIRAKSELYDYLRLNNGFVFFNADNQMLVNLSAGIISYSYGSDEDAYCQGSIAGHDPFLAIDWKSASHKGTIHTKLFGDYNFENVLAAVCIGLHFGVNPLQIDSAISSYLPDNNRSQVIKTNHNNIILDAYNANPSSMKAAIENFNQSNAKPKMLILGDMMELGTFSLDEHHNIVTMIRKLHFDKIIFIGESFNKAIGNGTETCFPGIDEAGTFLMELPVKGMTILLKGSRKMQLENLLNYL